MLPALTGAPLRISRAHAAEISPSENISPLCVFTPPVAPSMSPSAFSPCILSRANSSASSAGPFNPSRAHLAKYGVVMHALSIKV